METGREGRLCSSSIINVKENKNAIIRGIKKAMSNKFISSLNKTKSLYGNGNASKKMLQIIKTKDINIKKKFYE